MSTKAAEKCSVQLEEETPLLLSRKKKKKRDAVVFLFVLSGVRDSLRSQKGFRERHKERKERCGMGKKKGMVDWVRQNKGACMEGEVCELEGSSYFREQPMFSRGR